MFPYIRPQDIADILIMTFLVYQLYSWFKNTKALQVVIGLGFLVILYIVTKNLGLFMTSWVLQELGTVLFVLIIVIFQAEIRQALYRFSLLRNFFDRREAEVQGLDLPELSETIFSLASSRTGAIIAFERREPLDEYLLNGINLESQVSSQLVATIFHAGTPLHDGAIVIRGNRIIQASCHLPLSGHSELPQYYGTRHRAAVGLSERSDAVVVIVSEERGVVSVAVGGELRTVSTPAELSRRLTLLLVPPSPEVVKVSLRKKLIGNLGAKAVVTLLVIISWLIISGRQGGIVTVSAPIKYRNLPDNLMLTRTSPDEVEVQLKTLTGSFSSPRQLDVAAEINLEKVREGTHQLTITGDDFQLPLGVAVTGISPPVVKVTTEKKIRKMLRVRVRTTGSLPGKHRVRNISVDPEVVVAEGPEHVMGQYDWIEVEPIDLAVIRRSTDMTKVVVPPSPLVRVKEGEVTVRVQLSGR